MPAYFNTPESHLQANRSQKPAEIPQPAGKGGVFSAIIGISTKSLFQNLRRVGAPRPGTAGKKRRQHACGGFRRRWGGGATPPTVPGRKQRPREILIQALRGCSGYNERLAILP
jgi:hypothetical protein